MTKPRKPITKPGVRTNRMITKLEGLIVHHENMARMQKGIAADLRRELRRLKALYR